MAMPKFKAKYDKSPKFSKSPAWKREAMSHADVPGAGAKKRKHLRGQKKVGVVMSEFKRGTLRSGSGRKVSSRKQAIAIAMSEAGMSRRKK